MTTILGIDAAWTTGQPSGVALVTGNADTWRCAAVAPSYASFIALAEGKPVDWTLPTKGTPPDPLALLQAAAVLAGSTVDIVTVDMPVSTVPITQRRAADNAVSREFGGRWCSAHTPSVVRPGPLGAALSTAFSRLGYPVANAAMVSGTQPSLVEVYPHPALLALLNRPRRVPYKVSKAGKYWPDQTVGERIALLLAEFHNIERALAGVLGPFEVPLPHGTSISQLAGLKRYEDALDALVCCWVGMLYATGMAVPLGDSTGAVWCPRASLLTRH